MEEVHRQHLGPFVRTRAGRALDRVARPGVQLPPPTVGKPFVRHIADQRVSESEDSETVDLQELLQPLPVAWVGWSALVLQRRL